MNFTIVLQLIAVLPILQASFPLALNKGMLKSRNSRCNFRTACRQVIDLSRAGHLAGLQECLSTYKGSSELGFEDEHFILTHHAFINACRHGHLDIVKYLVKDTGLPAGTMNQIGMWSALRYGQKEVLDFLALHSDNNWSHE